jgi:N-acetylmuramoyl-L-alanine amidase
MRKIDKIVIHCSATPAGRDIGADEIRQWHLDRGWSDIGYHFVIRLDGTVEWGRPISRIGAGVAGHNIGSIHVCYVGGMDCIDTRTDAQKASLEVIISSLCHVFPGAEVLGHRDFEGVSKCCPSFDVRAENYG